MVASTDGNISLRLDPRRILTSPTGISKGMMTPDDLVITDLQGHKLSSRRNPSSELAMHLLIYSRGPDINAVCHAHPPPLPVTQPLVCRSTKQFCANWFSRSAVFRSRVTARRARPSLPTHSSRCVQSYEAILMANHGVVCYGQDLLSAFFRMETTEHFARVALVTELLGKQVLLSSGDVEKLLAARTRYGVQTASSIGPDCPVTADSADAERITLTRRELESIVDEAVQKERSRR